MMPILNEEETHVVGTRAVLDQDILPAGTSPVPLCHTCTLMLTIMPGLFVACTANSAALALADASAALYTFLTLGRAGQMEIRGAFRHMCAMWQPSNLLCRGLASGSDVLPPS